jgi:hypothetical protein
MAHYASARARREGIDLGKQTRRLPPDRFGFRREVSVNVYPASLLSGVAAELEVMG